MSRKLLSKFLDVFREPNDPFGGEQTVYEGESEFHHISIRREGAYLTMYFGPCGEEAETSINISNPNEAVFEYPGMMLAALPLHPQGKRVLLVGLGGGYLPGLFAEYLPDYQLVVVELDPLVAELAEAYFGYHPGINVELVIADGRDYIESLPSASVDQIWLDAFSGDYVPERLSGRAFLEICQQKLAPGGLLVQNFHQSRPHTFQNQLRTTREVLGPFVALDGQRCGNAIVINQVPGGLAEKPQWRQSELIKAARHYKRRVGPYDLAEEWKKFHDFSMSAAAQVLP